MLKSENIYICQYCGKKFFKKQSKSRHEKYCKLNPNKEIYVPWNEGKITNQIPWNKGLTKETSSQLKKMSLERMGENNPIHKHIYSDDWREKHSKIMKKCILEGKFSPNTNNRRTHFDITFENKKFRSSWEVLFWNNNKKLKYEKRRIEYFYKGNRYIYIVDFEDADNKILYEIKPSNLLKDDKTISKINYCKNWAVCNGYEFKIISEKEICDIISQTDLDVFDVKTKEKLENLYKRFNKL